MKRILFVCMGNICRSPAAEIVFRKMIDDAGLSERCEIDSAGTVDFQEGNPPDARMARHLRRRGYEVSGRARQVGTGDLKRFDLIVTMDEENRRDVLRMDVARGGGAKVVPFVKFLTEHVAEEIPDPYQGGDEGFARVLDLVEDGCAGMVVELFGK